ncbi:MAG: asparagine synthase (glutamine-hydrolyzing) [Acidobacteriia bacterium]|nr:asparagine synthase (glutamine-hydrolyzing) [Terriglobia bacterium]
MCGICGKLNFDREERVSPELLKRMADSIEHRGPDDEGYYRSGPVGFGFRRLSIIDLATGHQPLSNEDEKVWIVFNGEIYNYQELREYLQSEGHVFKTKTDTEVIVHLYEELGENCVEKLRGMFAFAIWDERQQTLFLARDRVGIKPLYYYLSERTLIFGSEIKAILADPEVQPEVVPGMIDRFLTFFYVPGEQTLLRNIYKLGPGSCMVVKDGKVRVRQYWDLEFSPRERSIQDAETELLSLLDEAVRLHMISDVPVGFLLSGGVDSTAMLGFTVGKTDKKLSSYTLGFSAPGLADERPYARLAAERYGSEHHEMTITSKEFADFLPSFAWHMEEPCCEPQAVALYYVSRLAKDYVKVLISGEGGDEAFAGYPIYRNLLWLERIKTALRPFNGALSAVLTRLNSVVRSPRIAKYAPLLNLPLESYYYSRTSNPGRFFNSRVKDLYSADFLHHVDKEISTSLVRGYLRIGAGSKLNKMLYTDTKTSLPDDLLLKADKMTMANSIELRVPFLDHKFLEFAAALPESLKVRWFTTKFIAKRAFKDRLPQQILRRKKVGFPVPYEAWQRTELKDWIQGLLLDREALSRGYFRKSCIEHLIKEDAQFGGYSKEILSLVSLELWHRAFLKPQKVAASHTESPVGGR